MKTKVLKYIIFTLLVVILFLPLYQQLYPFVELKPLNGEYKKTIKPSLSSKDWFSGEYQTHFDKYYNDTIGFRPFFVRTYNQIYYSIFSTSGNKGIVSGKDGYLYEYNYIDAYNGLDYLGDKKIDSIFFKLEKLQDTLKKLNKNIIIIFAPSKASFYPEYIPNSFFVKQNSKTNYQQITIKLKHTNLPYIDVNSWFIGMKDTSTYTLINRNGIHWTRYGECLVMDSITKFVNKLTDVQLPEIVCDSLVFGKAKYTDNDIGKAMNLFWIKDDLKLAYPEIRYDNSKASKKKLRPMVIGDSFYWGMHSIGFSDRVFSEGEFWYYFHNIYPETYKDGYTIQKYVALVDLKEEIKKFDLIILLQTEPNLNKFGFGFIDRAYDMFFVSGDGIDRKSDRLKYFMEIIKADKKWFNLIKEKAKKQNISIEQALHNDAVYMIEQKN